MSIDNNALPSRRRVIKAGGLAAIAAGAAAISPMTTGKILASVVANQNQRWGFLIDLNRCIGCKACAVACKTEFEVPLGVFRSSVKELDEGRFPHVNRSFLPWLCNHCENPVCLEGCPVDEIDDIFIWPDSTRQKYSKKATYKRPDGIVLVDQERCVGCGACVELCPYQVRFLNPAKQTVSDDAVDDHPADKCTLCVHRLEAGLVPACVNTCQANARIVGHLDDPSSEISKAIKANGAQVLLPGKGTKPACSYLALNPKTYSEGRDTR
jgi:tetrathionate reductase subunit B